MPFIGWLLVGLGGYFMGCAAYNLPPRESFLRIVKGEGTADLQWFKPPIVDFGPPKHRPTENGGNATVPGAGRDKVINFAKQQLGERYVFGASGPETWDCSGLTQQAYKQVGIALPHHAASQQRMGTKVSESNAQPGDLVFWGVIASHVGIYLGGGQVIHAPKTGDVVKISSIWDKNRVTYRSYFSSGGSGTAVSV